MPNFSFVPLEGTIQTFVLSAMNVAAPLSLCRHLKVLSQLSYQVIRMSSVKYAFAAA